MLSDKIKQLRLIAFLEGISFISLLFIAMPIKYMLGNPAVVSYVGMAHGVLFLLFLYALYEASMEKGWFMKFNVIAFICSLVPFGTFYLDTKLRRPEMIPVKK